MPTATSAGGLCARRAIYRNWITVDGKPGPSGDGGFIAAPGRYHLYVSHSCPWAYRTTLFRKLKKLENAISITFAAPLYGERSWRFADEPGAGPDTVNGKRELWEIYLLANPNYSGRVTVPTLWDKERKTIVNDESSEIIRMLNSAFNGYHRCQDRLLSGAAARRDRSHQRAGLHHRQQRRVSLAASPSRRTHMKRPAARCSPRSTSWRIGCRASATWSATRSPRPTGGRSRRSCVSTRSITTTSNAI